MIKYVFNWHTSWNGIYKKNLKKKLAHEDFYEFLTVQIVMATYILFLVYHLIYIKSFLSPRTLLPLNFVDKTL